MHDQQVHNNPMHCVSPIRIQPVHYPALYPIRIARYETPGHPRRRPKIPQESIRPWPPYYPLFRPQVVEQTGGPHGMGRGGAVEPADLPASRAVRRDLYSLA